MTNLKRMLSGAILGVLLGAAPLMLSACGASSTRFSRDDFFGRALPRNEELWTALTNGKLPSNRGVRWICNYALLLAESGRDDMLPRVARLVNTWSDMQDKDPASPTRGNFRWYWRHEKVTDLNAVEFVSHHMIPLWIDHRRRLGAETRKMLKETLKRSVEACMRRKVHPSYTNIAISNAVNLILLGEQFDRPDAFKEGVRRLDAVCLTSYGYGICEYGSPTYYGVDLDELVLLNKYVRSPKARRAGEAMLELFWTDIAANWFPPGGHLGGAHSRSYNYPCAASDFLDRHLAHAGWAPQAYEDWTGRKFLDSPESRFLDGAAWLDAEPGAWKPGKGLYDLAHKQYPRDVRQRFGSRPAHWRRQMVYRDITLGCAGKAYGVMDLPLTVSLPGDRTDSRCYFIADGREDPYGKRKFSVGSAGHTKALHLAPLWAAASGGDEAMAVALYPDRVINRSNVVNLQSHFVFRRPDAMYVGSRPCRVARGKPLPVAPGVTIALRYGTAALAVCFPWATRTDRTSAPMSIVDDGNPHNVLRLTVDHFAGKKTNRPGSALPGAAVWVQIASELTDKQFAQWRGELAPPKTEVSPKMLQLTSTGVSLTVDNPWAANRKVRIIPAPPKGILSINGKELGRGILESLETVRNRNP